MKNQIKNLISEIKVCNSKKEAIRLMKEATLMLEMETLLLTQDLKMNGENEDKENFEKKLKTGVMSNDTCSSMSIRPCGHNAQPCTNEACVPPRIENSLREGDNIFITNMPSDTIHDDDCVENCTCSGSDSRRFYVEDIQEEFEES